MVSFRPLKSCKKAKAARRMRCVECCCGTFVVHAPLTNLQSVAVEFNLAAQLPVERFGVAAQIADARAVRTAVP